MLRERKRERHVPTKHNSNYLFCICWEQIDDDIQQNIQILYEGADQGQMILELPVTGLDPSNALRGGWWYEISTKTDSYYRIFFVNILICLCVCIFLIKNMSK